jgi:hypothetical protein
VGVTGDRTSEPPIGGTRVAPIWCQVLNQLTIAV